MEFIRPQARITADGSSTLVCPLSGDTYHSLNGAITESVHVFLRNGFEFYPGKKVRIFEAGFGTGINAWLTAVSAVGNGRMVEYTAVELYPVDPRVLKEKGFPDDGLFETLHSSPWGMPVFINDNFTLTKLEADLAGCVFDIKFDIVYFDMFAPDTVPHLWTGELFGRLGQCMKQGGVLLTYSAKGDVKRALRAAGFEVHRLAGAPGKRHMLRAVKN